MAKFRVDDESGDRKYFTIIPNYVLNHSTAIDQALYLQMKRYAGENGSCYASGRTLRAKLGIGKVAYRKSIRYLLDHEWIYYKGDALVSTPGGEQMIPVYGIRDLWKINNEHYNKGGSKKNPLRKVGLKSAKVGPEQPTGGSRMAPKKNHEEDIYKDENIKKSLEAKADLDARFRIKRMG